MRSLYLIPILLLSCGTFGSDSDPSSGEPPPNNPNDPSKPPVIIEGERLVGVFVSSSKGSDAGDGSEGRPFKTIKDAMVAAQAKNERVILCAESYDENVVLLDGVSLYGYFECSTSPWAKTAKHATVSGPNVDPTLLVRGLTKPVRIEGVDFVGPDQTARLVGVRASSIAAYVRDSKDVSFAEVVLRGGKGMDGANGATPAVPSFTGGVAAGQTATKQRQCSTFESCNTYALAGAAGGNATCAVGPARPGGQGGEGATLNSGLYEIPNPNPAVAAADGRGKPFVATSEQAKGGVPGGKAVDGATGLAGKSGTNGTWRITNDAFIPGDGTPGEVAGPGQGGGGGGGNGACWRVGAAACASPGAVIDGSRYLTGLGAGGGAGGCGGLPGTPGGGGTASIGLFVVGSTVKVVRSTIEGGDAGAAGKGALGSDGGAGGAGGAGGPYDPIVADYYLWAGGGGKGGKGGFGGVGGHGAPGPSIGLVWTGTRPETGEAVVLNGGKAGAGHAGIEQPGGVGVPAVVGDSRGEHGF